jgi:hypothetical protein
VVRVLVSRSVVVSVSVVELAVSALQHGDVLGVLPLRAREGQRNDDAEKQVRDATDKAKVMTRRQ